MSNCVWNQRVRSSVRMLGLACAMLVAPVAIAQEYNMLSGNPERTGIHSGNQQTENPGRAFLRWWDPVTNVSRTIDNTDPECTLVPNTQLDWRIPQSVRAYNAYEPIFGVEPYRYAKTIAALSYDRPTQKQNAADVLRTATWTFQSTVAYPLNPGDDIAISVNIPIGPTLDTVQSQYFFPQRYYVYEISGVEGGPYIELIDTFVANGGWVRLGGGGYPTETLYRVDNTATVRITLYNTVPKDASGQLTDSLNTVVYADAAKVTKALFGELGSYSAQPVIGSITAGGEPYPWRVVAARNEPLTVQVGPEILTFNLGVISSYVHEGTTVDPTRDFGRNVVWTAFFKRPYIDSQVDQYAEDRRSFIINPNVTPTPDPSDQPGLNRSKVTIDKDNLSAGVTQSFSWVALNQPVGFKGLDFLVTPAANSVTESVTYQPKLTNGSYDIYVWLPLDAGFRQSLGRRVQYEIYEGASPTVVEVDQSAAGGWVRLASTTRSKFNHNNASAPLRVVVTNFSQGDAGLRQVYADNVRFVTQADLAVTSAPVHVRATIQTSPGVFQDKDVVIVAMENGRLYCMDAQGNSTTGTTTVYWVYPSEKQLGPLPSDNQDPNRVSGLDGPDGIAENPIGFNTSGALVKRVQTGPLITDVEDLLYIGSENGRVYCINVTGRGDGTTFRRWSYPDDYPAPAVSSALGPIDGSVAFGDIGTVGNPLPTIFVPTSQGRLYALDAVGNIGTRTTTVRWAYPQVTDPTVGPARTPACFAFGNVYFGTDINAGDTAGRLYAVDAATGNLVWQFAGNGGNDTLGFSTAGVAAIPAGEINYGTKNLMPNTVFFANANGRAYALNAATGATIWETNELGASPAASVAFTWLRTYDTNGLMVNPPGQPMVIVPTVDGRWSALYANVQDLNKLGLVDGFRRRAWEYVAEAGPVYAGVAVGGGLTGTDPNDPGSIAPSNWLYGADNVGYLYAFSDVNIVISPGTPPGSQTIVENDPILGELDQIAANAKVALLTPENYENISDRLRSGQLTYADITQAAVTQGIQRRKFEYGEVIYAIIYDLPNPANFTPPLNGYQLDFQFNSPGAASQRRIVSPVLIPNSPPQDRECFALSAYVVMGTQADAVAPGVAYMITRVQIPNRQNSNRQINQQVMNFLHPLAVEVRRPGGASDSIGLTTDINNDNEILNNGNDRVNGGYKELLSGLGPDMQNPGDEISHGNTGVTPINVYDRSLITLIKGPMYGLTNVRMATSDLAWQGGPNAVVKPLDPVLYPDYEELPAFVPNVSLDYPDLRRDGLRVASDVYGEAGNPLLYPIVLRPPKNYANNLPAYRGYPGYENGLARSLDPTPFDVSLDVPKYQPASTAGYKGVQVVYVDANQPGRQWQNGAPIEAYREVSLFGQVAVDERMSIGTPTVDLGSLPAGGGFGTIAPWDNASPFSPWNSAYNSFFQRFVAYNEGNTNLLNVRVAKGNAIAGLVPIPLGGGALHELAWMDASWSLWSDLDPRFAPAQLNNRVIFQKPRPGDPSPSRLSVNPIRRRNANLGVLTDGPHPNLDPALFPPGDPKVGVTAPIGTPVGRYVQEIGVIEDRNDNLVLESADPYADPPFTLMFTVRETRLTNRNTTKAAPMIDDLGLTGQENMYWPNSQASGIRDAAGNLLVAFSSPRMVDVGNDGNKANDLPGWLSRLRDENDFTDPFARDEQWRIYIATLDGTTPANGLGASPLAELNSFVANTSSRWFIHAAGPLPGTSPDVLFGPLQPGESIVPRSVVFGSPTFAYGAPFNPMSPPSNRTTNPTYYLAFVGECKKRNQRGELMTDSRIFVVSVVPGATGLRAVLEPAMVLPFDPAARKSRPSLIQVGTNATVFYTANAGGLSQIFWSSLDARNGSWRQPSTLQLGNGFESVGAPQASLRRYRNGGQARIDLVFSAKVRGRAQQEVFMTRLEANSNGEPRGRNASIFYPVRTDPLIQDPTTGLYWSQGVEWSLRTTSSNPMPDIDLFALVGGSLVSQLDANSGRYDANTGIVTYDTRLGGKVYLNSATGSVRFSGATIPREMKLYLRYQPKYLRVTPGLGANSRASSLVFDDRYIGETSYWADSNNNGVPPNVAARSDRFLLAYTKNAADGGQAGRPYMRTMRFGVQLPTAVQVNPNGQVAFLQVGGMLGSYYQVDPALGRIYFQAEDEDNPNLTVSYRGVDENGVPYNAVIGPLNLTCRLMFETEEAAVPIEQPVNETGLAMALDPFPIGPNQPRRPGLVWLFWTSTRSGAPDLYYQTVAPRFTPKPPGR